MATRTSSPGRRQHGPLLLLYGAMICSTVWAFLLIRAYGATLAAPTISALAPRPSPPAGADVLMRVLLALFVITVACRVLGRAVQRLGQPPVIGEILAGLVIGPSLVGRLAPAVSTYLFPDEVLPFLGMLSQFGVILFMFVVGLELDASSLRERGHAALIISHASIVVPFLLGSLLALGLYSRFSTGEVSFTVFALFLGAAMSVTAFPVLTRILTDLGIDKTPLRVMALTISAVDDVTAWGLLALVVGVANARMGSVPLVLLGSVVYIALMLFLVRPLVRRIPLGAARAPSGELAAILLLTVLLSAWTTEFIGIHAIFGAFLLGVIIPHESGIARLLAGQLRDFVSVLLLPVFFAYTGLRLQVGLIAGTDWLICLLITLVATLGKFGGTFAAGRMTGEGWRSSATLGILMNTRGLMELIFLNIGLELGVISPALYAMMVLMTLATTAATTPLLRGLSLPSDNTKARAGPASIS